jgi:simple sugar transport system permease protein
MLPGMEVHWGLVYGLVFCVLCFVVVRYTVYGFSLRVVGGNVRAARMTGLPVGGLLLGSCFLGGAAAGLAGMLEVAAVHGSANASLIAGYGYAGILVAFIARHNPLAVMPVAILLGGIAASGGMLQRRLDLPDATVLVLQGIAFMTILAAETLYGRFRLFQPRGAA